jgi:hypothetical protein
MEILKITAKSAPIPTVVAIIIYVIYPKIIDSNPSETVLILTALLTFLVLLALLAFAAFKKEVSKSQTLSGNAISNIKTDTGDVFIGNKTTFVENEQINDNKIDDVSSGSGDVFIGQKK